MKEDDLLIDALVKKQLLINHEIVDDIPLLFSVKLREFTVIIYLLPHGA